MATKGVPPTVCNFLTVLTSKLTQYDQATSKREMKRGHVNIYRLGHLIGAAEKVREDVKAALPDCNVTLTSETASLLRRSLQRRFESGFPPVKNVQKQIDAFLLTGKNPSLLAGASCRRSCR